MLTWSYVRTYSENFYGDVLYGALWQTTLSSDHNRVSSRLTVHPCATPCATLPYLYPRWPVSVFLLQTATVSLVYSWSQWVLRVGRRLSCTVNMKDIAATSRSSRRSTISLTDGCLRRGAMSVFGSHVCALTRRRLTCIIDALPTHGRPLTQPTAAESSKAASSRSIKGRQTDLPACVLAFTSHQRSL